MKYLWLGLSVFMTVLSLGGISSYAEKKDNLGILIAVLVVTVLCWVQYKKSKTKKAAPVSEIVPQKNCNPELMDFFDKPVAESAQKIQEQLEGETDDFLKKQKIFDNVEHIIDLAYEDGIISKEEEQKLTEYMEYFKLTVKDLPRPVHEKLIKGLVIRDLLEGTYNNRIMLASVPFNFMKSEKVIFAFPSVSLSEIKTVSEYQAGSRGMSFRIMKGVYYHTGGTKGKRIEKQVLKNLGLSSVAITNKHLYFQANGDAMRIKHDKIISILPSTDGVIVYREGARSNPLFFRTDDAWFFANVLQNAQNVR